MTKRIRMNWMAPQTASTLHSGREVVRDAPMQLHAEDHNAEHRQSTLAGSPASTTGGKPDISLKSPLWRRNLRVPSEGGPRNG